MMIHFRHCPWNQFSSASF